MTMGKSKERSHLKTINQKCDGNPQGLLEDCGEKLFKFKSLWVFFIAIRFW